MQKYKLPIIIIIVFAVFILAAYFMIQTNQKKELSLAIDAVPLDATFILETNNISELTNSIQNNETWNNTQDIILFSQLDDQLHLIDSLLNENFNLLVDKNILISGHLQGKNKVHLLCLVSLPRSADQKRLKKRIEILLENKAVITERKHDGTKIFDVKFNDDLTESFSFSLSKGILIFSKSTLLTENAVRQIKSNNSIAIDYNFKKISKTAGKNVIANYYINYETFTNTFKHLLSSQLSKKTKKINDFANWSSLDLNFNGTSILLNGFSYAGTNHNKFINIFAKQSPVKNTVAEILPEETSFFTTCSFSDKYKFKENFVEYLKSHDLEYDWNKKNEDFNKKYQINIQKELFDVLDNQITFATADFSEYLIIKVNSQKNAKKVLSNITEVYCSLNNLKIEDHNTKYKLEEELVFDVYKIPFDNILDYAFENLYKNIEHKYYFFYEEYLIFTDSYDNLKKIIQTTVYKTNLKNTESYKKLEQQTTSKSNIFIYKNLSKNTGQNIQSLNNDMSDWYRENKNILSKFQELSIQFSAQNELFYTNIVLNYNPQAEISNSAVWKMKLDGKIITKPLFFTNHYSFKKEIFVQDILKNIYLIDNNGKVLFKQQLPENIIGNATQIDYYNNSKHQLLFNTENYIYIIDRNGKNIDGFPVKLESPATNELAVFDYDNDKNYRFFVACKDKKIYLYQKDGKVNEGWQKINTELEVTKPIQYFNYDGKDYIVFSDKSNIYIRDRRGEQRIVADKKYAISENSPFYFQKAISGQKAGFIITNTTGDIIKINLDGKIELKNTEQMSVNHFFEYADINGDGYKDYVFVEKNHLIVLDHKLSPIYKYDFLNQITKAPIVLHFSADDIKIGIISTKEKKIYLINNDGNIHKGFPLKGNTEFSVGILNSQNKFNLIVGFIDKSIYNYQIQ